MIKYTSEFEVNNRLFSHPFERDLDRGNRWFILRELTPWDELAQVLMKSMSDQGRASIDLRYVLGVLIIQSMENLTDEGVLQAVQENIYMQYFIGLPSFTTQPLFTPELLVTIRKRLGETGSVEFNEVILNHKTSLECTEDQDTSFPNKEEDKPQDNAPEDTENHPPEKPNRGVLKVDASIAPAHIKYPTDIDLLNQCRKFCESLIDLYWKEGLFDLPKKPRTYRQVLDKQILSLLKSKKLSQQKRRKGIRILLASLKRDFTHINTVLDRVPDALSLLNKKQYRNWLVVQHIYTQQQEMYRNHTHKVKDRIVSLHQPWVRPMVRGKSGKQTEFGAQINMTEQDGYVDFFRTDFNKFNEAEDLIPILQAYHKKYNCWPESVLVDQIFLNRTNRAFLKDKNIAHYGVPLGRKPKLSPQERKERRLKQNKRSEVEGKFGQAKMRFGMNKIHTKNYSTSLCKIGLIAFAMNLWKILKDFSWLITFCVFFKTIFNHKTNFRLFIQQKVLLPIITTSNFPFKTTSSNHSKIVF